MVYQIDKHFKQVIYNVKMEVNMHRVHMYRAELLKNMSRMWHGVDISTEYQTCDPRFSASIDIFDTLTFSQFRFARRIFKETQLWFKPTVARPSQCQGFDFRHPSLSRRIIFSRRRCLYPFAPHLLRTRAASDPQFQEL